MLMHCCLAALLLSLSTLRVHISIISWHSHDSQYCMLEGLGQVCKRLMDILIVRLVYVNERAWIQGQSACVHLLCQDTDAGFLDE